MSDSLFSSSIILNRLLSSSKTQSKQAAPAHGGEDLLDIIRKRFELGYAIEFFGGDDEHDDAKRVSIEHSGNFIKISDCQKSESPDEIFYSFLIEFGDWRQKKFPVVDTKTYKGRELSGSTTEIGASATHFVVKLPARGAYDDQDYRCAIEYSPSVRRLDIETLLCRQLRRVSFNDGWDFPIERTGKRGQPLKEKRAKYHAKLELAVDVGRSLSAANSGKTLSQVIFTKKSEMQSIGQATSVDQIDIVTDLEIRVSGKQAPSDPAEQKNWLERVLSYYSKRGYTNRLYYRGPSGQSISGGVDQAAASAIDLLMCPREIVSLAADPPRWRETIDPEICAKMKLLLSNDALWERPRS